jgi:hypothetical protein
MAHPKDLGTTYSRQFSRPEDAIRERENEQRKADLHATKVAGLATAPRKSWATSHVGSRNRGVASRET